MGLTFPSIAGSEGVGIAQKIGEEVTSIGEKDTVMIVRPVQGRVLFSSFYCKVLGVNRSLFLKILSYLLLKVFLLKSLLPFFIVLVLLTVFSTTSKLFNPVISSCKTMHLLL